MADTPAAVLIKHMQDPLPAARSFVPDLPEAVEQVLFKALAKEPENRYQNMGAFAEALGKLAYWRPDHPGFRCSRDGNCQSTHPKQINRSPDGNSASTSRCPTREEKNRRLDDRLDRGWNCSRGGIFGYPGGWCLLCVPDGTNRSRPQPFPPLLEASTNCPHSPNPPRSNPLQLKSLRPRELQILPSRALKDSPRIFHCLTDNNGDLMKSTSQGMTMYNFSTNMIFKQVVDFYKTGMTTNGWQIMNETTQANMYYWVFTKGDNRQVMISVIDQNGEKVSCEYHHPIKSIWQRSSEAKINPGKTDRKVALERNFPQP